MARFVKLTGSDGSPVFINMNLVTEIFAVKDMAKIIFVGGTDGELQSSFVKEMPEQIIELISRQV